MAGGARVLLVGAAPALGGPHRERDGAAGAAERSAGSELLGKGKEKKEKEKKGGGGSAHHGRPPRSTPGAVPAGGPRSRRSPLRSRDGPIQSFQ